MKFDCLDVDKRTWGGLETLFPGWSGADESVCVYSPHDDDAILGAGYAMRAAVEGHFRRFDPRPKLDFSPYRRLIASL